MWFAQQWNEKRVRACLRQQDPHQLAEFVKARHYERFFRPLKTIRAAPGNMQGYGAAIMALCSLLIETIQCYRFGLPTTDGKEFRKLAKRKGIPAPYQLHANEWKSGTKTFQRFFHDHRDIFQALPGGRFYKNVRCGLLHQGQTKRGWVIKRRGLRVWDPTRKTIYRNDFSESLERAFKAYLGDLRTSRWGDRICRRAARKVWWLLRLS